jgi:arylsulfatase A-like enzyme
MGCVIPFVFGCGGDAPKPNVVVISIDTLRADALGVYGGPMPTPGLDRLAGDGVLMQWAFAPTPTTAPSHATLFSGRDVQTHGTVGNGRLSLPQLPLAEAFRSAGYATAGFVSSYVLSRDLGWATSFDHFDDRFEAHVGGLEQMNLDMPGDLKPFEGRPLDRHGLSTASAVRAWLQSAPEPFFLFIHLFDPHTPYQARSFYLRRLRDVRFDAEGRVTPQFSNDAIKHAMLGYHAEVLFADEALQSILRAIEQRGLRDRTIVSVTADHGEGLGQHGWMGHTVHLYDEQIRVPWILRWPKMLKAGTRVVAPVGLVDVAPTIAELAGVTLPGPVDGRSLAEALRAGVEPDVLPVFGVRPPLGESYAQYAREKRFVRTDRWKLIRGEGQPDELYDLLQDPGETRNLAAERPTITAELGALLDARTAAAPLEQRQLDLSPEQSDALKALGYGN